MARYVDYLRGAKGPSGFGSKTTAEEVTQGIDLSGKTAIVTGSNSGIGAETARVLALRGARVVMAVRNVKSGEEVKNSILKSIPDAQVEVMHLDLSSLKQVRDFAEEFKSKGWPLNILINNAGVMMCPFEKSKDGHEMQFAVNHLGHFLLTRLLLNDLKSSADVSKTESRIVNVSSMAHHGTYKGGVIFDHLDDEAKYNKMLAYGQSKLANVLHARELTRKLQEDGVGNVTVNALCPGGILTNLQRYSDFALNAVLFIWKPFLKTVEQGAATTCYVATNPSLNTTSGKYFYDCNEHLPSKLAQNDYLAKSLWERSETLVQ